MRSLSATIGQARRGHGDAVVQRGDDDAPAGPGEVGGVAVDDRQVEAMIEQHFAAGGAAEPSPSAATTTRKSVGEQLGETLSQARPVAGDRSPTGRLDDRGVRGLGRRVDRPERRRRRRRAGGRARRAAGGRRGRGRVPTSTPAPRRGRPPRRAGRWRGRGCDVARRARPWPSPGSTSVSSVGSRLSSSHGSQLSIPSKNAPSASRSHCSRPHGSRATRRSARSRTASVGSSSRAGKISASARSPASVGR